jgi:hypothetical protein
MLYPRNAWHVTADSCCTTASSAFAHRQKRMERQPGGGYKYVKRTEFYGGCSVDDVSLVTRITACALCHDKAS